MTDPVATRTIAVDALARVEGEGAMHVEIRDGQVQHVQLRIYEPPRFFEAFLRGRDHLEPPDLTARICGICPVAYQMSACNAIEAACGVQVDGVLADLRRLLYCGEWIESHTLHVYMLHAPDFLGYPSAIEMATDDRPVVERGLRLKKAGNAVVRLLGGRPIHPINVRVGGFYRAPTVAEMAALRVQLDQARDEALATVAWVAGFDFLPFETDHELVALRGPGEYPMADGRLVSTGGLDLGPDELADQLSEDHVAHSTALHARLRDRGPYLLGPLSRFALNFDQLRPAAREAAEAAGIGPGVRNPYRSIVVRAVEVLQACDDAVALIDRYRPPEEPAVAVEPRAAVGCGWSEAPRGLLWHRYELDGDGTIVDADIVPPTSQNQRAIEDDLFYLVEQELDRSDDELRHRSEQLIRSYDPCISCSTHFLDLTVDRS